MVKLIQKIMFVLATVIVTVPLLGNVNSTGNSTITCPDSWIVYTEIIDLSNGLPYCTGDGGDQIQTVDTLRCEHWIVYEVDGRVCKGVPKTFCANIGQHTVVTPNAPSCREHVNVTFALLGEQTPACTFTANIGNGFENIKNADGSIFVKAAEQHDITITNDINNPFVIRNAGLCSLDLWGSFWPKDVYAYEAYDLSTGGLTGYLVKGSWRNDYWYWTNYFLGLDN